jgi:DNA-binding MarR family transcriptional regulator
MTAIRERVTPYDVRVLRALRRIFRAVDIHSRRLSESFGLTAPQLVCLDAIREATVLTTSGLAHQVQLSPSTVVGIVDRLERKGLVQRMRDTRDRRVVNLSLTAQGKRTVRRAPSPLQDKLAAGLAALAPEDQETVAASLERIVEMVEAGRIDAAPLLESGPLVPPERPKRSR